MHTIQMIKKNESYVKYVEERIIECKMKNKRCDELNVHYVIICLLCI